MRINKLTDYAFLLLCELKENELISSKELSQRTKVKFATTNKILRILTKNKICLSKGGKFGGFSLKKPQSSISLLEIINLIEGTNTNLTECSKNNSCQLQKFCKISSKIKLIDIEIQNILKSKFIIDLI